VSRIVTRASLGALNDAQSRIMTNFFAVFGKSKAQLNEPYSNQIVLPFFRFWLLDQLIALIFPVQFFKGPRVSGISAYETEKAG
jgi:hypothetical protein